MISSFRLICVFVFVKSLFIFSSCSKYLPASEEGRTNASYEVACSSKMYDLRLVRKGTTYQSGDRIGAGEMGVVYNIKSPNLNDRWARDHVLKAYPFRNF